MTNPAQPWAAIVPVKRLALAKTRLRLPRQLRAKLALAMAVDTVAAARAATCIDQVVVVTDDDAAAEATREIGAVVVDDQPDAGLNPALLHGAAVAMATDPARGVVAMSSDLPALTGGALDHVLEGIPVGTATFVADAAATGTVLLAARPAELFRPLFGPDSARRHAAAGAVDVTGRADSRVRRDVDTLANLAAAAALGCGAATEKVLAEHPELLTLE